MKTDIAVNGTAGSRLQSMFATQFSSSVPRPPIFESRFKLGMPNAFLLGGQHRPWEKQVPLPAMFEKAEVGFLNSEPG